MTADDYPLADRQRMAAVAQLLAESLDWQVLSSQGTSNRLYRAQAQAQAQIQTQSLVLRLNADAQQAFGVDRQRETAVLALIQGYDWAPQVLHNAWQQGWCLMADAGVALVPNSSVDPVPALLAALAEWQQINPQALKPVPFMQAVFTPPPLTQPNFTQSIFTEPTFHYQVLIDAYRHALRGCPEPLAIRVLARFEQLFTKLPSVPACLTHHDLHWGNLCQKTCSSADFSASANGDANLLQLVILDWEYAVIGNPWFDAAALHQQFGVSADRIAALPAWRSLNTQQVARGLTIALWLNEALNWLWYQVRGGCPTATRYLQAQQLLTSAGRLA